MLCSILLHVIARGGNPECCQKLSRNMVLTPVSLIVADLKGDMLHSWVRTWSVWMSVKSEHQCCKEKQWLRRSSWVRPLGICLQHELQECDQAFQITNENALVIPLNADFFFPRVRQCEEELVLSTSLMPEGKKNEGVENYNNFTTIRHTGL